MTTQFYSADRYAPSPQDVLQVKQELLSRIHLPLELIDAIIDHAEYWPKTVTQRGDVIISSGRNENRFLLRSFPIGYAPQNGSYQFQEFSTTSSATAQPLPWPKDRKVPNTSTAEVLGAWTSAGPPRTDHPVRKIVFTIKSHDQGWGGDYFEGEPYKGSYTWFDVGREEICAFSEDSVSEQYKNAPWPQVLINRKATREVTLGNGKKVQLPDNSSLVCGFRTIAPESVEVPASPSQEHDDFDFHLDNDNDDGDGADESGGLVDPPDALNSGPQAPFVPWPTEFTHTGVVDNPAELNHGSQESHGARPAHGFRARGGFGGRGRCGVGMAPPHLDSNAGSSAYDQSGQAQSSFGGLVGPPDELNPGSQAPLNPSGRREVVPQQPKWEFEHVFLPDDSTLQTNRRAESDWKTHVITWSRDDKIDPESLEGEQLKASGRGKNTGDGEFVRSLKVGDCITVWGKSRFGGWANHVEYVKMEVYWTV